MTKKTKKTITGWMLVAVYALIPIILGFGKAKSHLEYWDWVNVPLLIAVWELLMRDSFFELRTEGVKK